MKKMKKLMAIMMAVISLFGCAEALAEMPGIWVCTEETDELDQSVTSLWQYTFKEDGSYEYVDMAIGYQEYGTYEVIGTKLILTRSGGETEEYELTGDDWAFRGVDEDEELMFARKNTHAMVASAENR